MQKQLIKHSVFAVHQTSAIFQYTGKQLASFCSTDDIIKLFKKKNAPDDENFSPFTFPNLYAYLYKCTTFSRI